MQEEYICYTRQGQWSFYAEQNDPTDAMRRALWYCHRDGEDFIKIESKGFPRCTLRICLIDNSNSIQTL